MVMKHGDAIVTTGSTNLDPYGLLPMLDVIDEAIKSGEEALEVLPIQEEPVPSLPPCLIRCMPPRELQRHSSWHTPMLGVL